MYSFSYLEPVCCSMSSSNCCFLTCIQITQEADQVVWYSHLFKNFPQFVVIHTVSYFILITDVQNHFSGDSQVALVVKSLPANAEDVEKWVWFPGLKIPWKRKWQPTLVFLPWQFYEQRSLAGYGLWDCKELDTTEHLTGTWLWLRSWTPYCKIQT